MIIKNYLLLKKILKLISDKTNLPTTSEPFVKLDEPKVEKEVARLNTDVGESKDFAEKQGTKPGPTDSTSVLNGKIFFLTTIIINIGI